MRRVIIGVLVTSLVYNLPRFFELKPDFESKKIERTSLGHNSLYKKVYTDAMYYTVTFVLPLTLLAVLNTCVIWRYRRVIARRRQMTSTRSRSQSNGRAENGSTRNSSTGRAENDNNITFVMIMVVLVFMICQAPARAVQMMYSYKYDTCAHASFYLIHISNSLEVINSSVNFIIYVAFRARFFNVLRSQVCKCACLTPSEPLSRARTITTEGLPLVEYPQPPSQAQNGEDRQNSLSLNDARDTQVTEVRRPSCEDGKRDRLSEQQN